MPSSGIAGSYGSSAAAAAAKSLQSCPTLCDPMNRSTPGLPVHHQLREFTETHVHWVSDSTNHLTLCHPLLNNESALRIRWPKYWSFSLSINPTNEYSGLISFRKFPLGLTDWISLQSKGLSRDFSNTTVQTSILRTAIWPSNPTAGHTHQGNQNWKRHVYPNVHRSTVYNSQDMKAT